MDEILLGIYLQPCYYSLRWLKWYGWWVIGQSLHLVYNYSSTGWIIRINPRLPKSSFQWFWSQRHTSPTNSFGFGLVWLDCTWSSSHTPQISQFRCSGPTLCALRVSRLCTQVILSCKKWSFRRTCSWRSRLEIKLNHRCQCVRLHSSQALPHCLTRVPAPC